MNQFRIVLISALIVVTCACGAAAQETLPSDESAPLVLVRIIPIPGVEGRFDHMAVDNKNGRVFASVYGNDSVEVLDAQRGKRIHSIRKDLSNRRWWLTSPTLTASWSPAKETALARFWMRIRTN